MLQIAAHQNWFVLVYGPCLDCIGFVSTCWITAPLRLLLVTLLSNNGQDVSAPPISFVLICIAWMVTLA
jgi:hypothetical protein